MGQFLSPQLFPVLCDNYPMVEQVHQDDHQYGDDQERYDDSQPIAAWNHGIDLHGQLMQLVIGELEQLGIDVFRGETEIF